MSFISPKGLEFGYIKHLNKYCILGMYCSDTDFVECILLPENKYKFMNVDLVDVIKDERVKSTLKVLYIKNNTDE
jgi:hypothetical protein